MHSSIRDHPAATSQIELLLLQRTEQRAQVMCMFGRSHQHLYVRFNFEQFVDSFSIQFQRRVTRSQRLLNLE